MARYSEYSLNGRGRPPRISEVHETDTEIANALIDRFGDRVTAVYIEGRTIELHGVPIQETKLDPVVNWWDE